MLRKGFTLIELLIVITIIAILAGSAVPYVQDYVEDARFAKVRADLGELRNAIMRYEVDNGKLFDPVDDKSFQQVLVGPYLISALIDPWGRPYYFSNNESMVYSAGQDGDPDTNIIRVAVRPRMAPTRAWWIDTDNSTTINEDDLIEIKFTRPIDIATGGITLGGPATQIVNFGDYIFVASAGIADNSLTNAKFTSTTLATDTRGDNWIRLRISAGALPTAIATISAGVELVVGQEIADRGQGKIGRFSRSSQIPVILKAGQ